MEKTEDRETKRQRKSAEYSVERCEAVQSCLVTKNILTINAYYDIHRFTYLFNSERLQNEYKHIYQKKYGRKGSR